MGDKYEWEDYEKEIHDIIEGYVLEYAGVEIELSDVEISAIHLASEKLIEGLYSCRNY